MLLGYLWQTDVGWSNFRVNGSEIGLEHSSIENDLKMV